MGCTDTPGYNVPPCPPCPRHGAATPRYGSGHGTTRWDLGFAAPTPHPAPCCPACAPWKCPGEAKCGVRGSEHPVLLVPSAVRAARGAFFPQPRRQGVLQGRGPSSLREPHHHPAARQPQQPDGALRGGGGALRPAGKVRVPHTVPVPIPVPVPVPVPVPASGSLQVLCARSGAPGDHWASWVTSCSGAGLCGVQACRSPRCRAAAGRRQPPSPTDGFGNADPLLAED